MTEYPYGSTTPSDAPAGTGTSEYPYATVPPVVGLGEGATSGGSIGDENSPSMSDKASSTVDAGKQAASDVASTAAEKAKDVALETKKQARDLLGEAKTQFSEQLGSQHSSLVDNLRSLAGELSNMSQGTNIEGGGMATDLVGQAGDRVNGVAEWLGQRQPGDLVGELRTFARQRPGAFLVGAALAGVLAGRLTRGVVAARSDDSAGAADQYPATSPGDSFYQYEAPVSPSGTGGYGTADYSSPAGAYEAPGGSYGTPPASAGYSVPPTGHGSGGYGSGEVTP